MRRPQKLADYIGQEQIKTLLAPELARRPVRHILLTGGPGLGKTSLANLIAGEIGAEYVALDPNATVRQQIDTLLRLDITGYNRDGSPGPGAKKFLCFIDEAHLVISPEAWLYTAMEDETVPHHGGISWIPETTFVLATTDVAKLKKPLRDRCQVHLNLRPYTEADLCELLRRRYNVSAKLARSVAIRARGTARLAINYCEGVLAFGGDPDAYFAAAEIDDEGLTPLDRQYLDILYGASAPVSLQSIAARLCESPKTISEMVEPYLLQTGRIEVSGKGRVLATRGRGPKSLTLAG